MEYRKIKDEDDDGRAVSDDIEILRGKGFLVVASVSNVPPREQTKWKCKTIITLALTFLTSSQAILIVWSKRVGKYEYSVTTTNFLVSGMVIMCFDLTRLDKNMEN